MKLATALIPFFDLVEGVQRKAGDTFTCDDERASYLVECCCIKSAEAVAEKPKRRKKKEQ